MKTAILSKRPKAYVLVCDIGDEVLAVLKGFASEQGIEAGHLTAIGAFSEATLGFFEWERKEYTRIPVTEQVEVLSLVGNVARKNGQPQVHCHVVLGRSDGTTLGGHLMEAHVRPTLEMIITESPKDLARRIDDRVGLALLDVEAMKRS